MRVKDHFVSRYGKEGILIECDWTGLEISGWGYLTQDPTLVNLLNSGKDMHRFIGAKVLDCKPEDITKEQRSKLKPANFTLIYGGTDWNLVNKDGLDPDLAKTVYDTFWNLFPVARMWSDNLMKQLDANAKPCDRLSPGGKQVLESWYRGITGRKFFFYSYPDKISKFCAENRIYTPKGFKYAEGMNYQCQSFSTADIHMIALGLLFREAIKHRDKFLMINTIHDSVLIDCRIEYLDFVCELVKNTMEKVIKRLEVLFNIGYNVPLSIELKSGLTWSQMIEYKPKILVNQQ